MVFISEGVLLAVALLWWQLASLPLALYINFEALLIGLAATIPPLLINWRIFERPWLKLDQLLKISEFRNNIILPLVADLKGSDALILGICSGIAEELFFRGTLQSGLLNSCGFAGSIIVTNLLFSVIHFGSASRHFFGLVVLYFAVGLYLSWVLQVSGSLLAPIITHATYNFLAISYLLRQRLRS